MLAAEKELEFLPDDAKPTGCKMQRPEIGCWLEADTRQLVVRQEFPDDNGSKFSLITSELARLAGEYFTPSAIESNGYALESFTPAPSEEAALKNSLSYGGQFQNSLETVVGMPAISKALDYKFVSGKSELHVTLRPVTFEKVTAQRLTAGFGSSKGIKRAVERLNKQADRAQAGTRYAIMLLTDLKEIEPPPGMLEKHFSRLLTIDSKLKDFGLKG